LRQLHTATRHRTREHTATIARNLKVPVRTDELFHSGSVFPKFPLTPRIAIQTLLAASS
jgi:hypothetical protein